MRCICWLIRLRERFDDFGGLGRHRRGWNGGDIDLRAALVGFMPFAALERNRLPRRGRVTGRGRESEAGMLAPGVGCLDACLIGEVVEILRTGRFGLVGRFVLRGGLRPAAPRADRQDQNCKGGQQLLHGEGSFGIDGPRRACLAGSMLSLVGEIAQEKEVAASARAVPARPGAPRVAGAGRRRCSAALQGTSREINEFGPRVMLERVDPFIL